MSFVTLKKGMKFILNPESDKSDWKIDFDDLYGIVYTVMLVNDGNQAYNVRLEYEEHPIRHWQVNEKFLKEHFIYMPDEVKSWRKELK